MSAGPGARPATGLALRPIAASLAALAVLGALGAGCRDRRGPERPRARAPVRGVVLISIDALRADHLGAYGYGRDTSPFLDRLAAERGVLFESAAVQYPSTLTSHFSMLTGLYPGEHGVYPPDGVLSEEIATVAERFRAAGFRTAGHTEGGFMAGGFGFARGFEEFSDPPHEAESDVERTFASGLDFLERRKAGERFFLFLHTYAVHDPYEPPERLRRLFWNGPPPPGPPPTGPELRRLAAAGPPDPELARYYEALYDASIRYVDERLQAFFEGLERLGLARETAVVVTSDHGEEFGEHGGLGHARLYPEVLFVPLVVAAPGLPAGERIATLVESVDVAPTLLALAGIEPAGRMTGVDLLPLAREPGRMRPSEAYAEQLVERRERTLLRRDAGGFHQLLAGEPHPDPEGTWIGEAIAFDASEPRLAFEARSFHRPRRLELRGAGAPALATRVETAWQTVAFDLPGEPALRRLELAADGCETPRALGVGDDERCLAVLVRGLPLWETELYELGEDPGAQRELGAERPAIHAELARRLAEHEHEPVAPPGRARVSEETLETLKALGYLD